MTHPSIVRHLGPRCFRRYVFSHQYDGAMVLYCIRDGRSKGHQPEIVWDRNRTRNPERPEVPDDVWDEALATARAAIVRSDK